MEACENFNQNNSNDEETSESSSSSDEESVDIVSDKDFFKTLSCLKNKDPSIYDNSVQFFTKPLKDEPKKNKKEQLEKSVYVKDYVIGVLDDDLQEENNTPKPLTYVEEQEATKKFFKNELESNSSSEDESEDLMKIKLKDAKDKEVEEADYVQFLKGHKSELENKEEEKELKPLHDFWNKRNLDQNEKFLKDYILNRKYLLKETEDVPNEENLSEDERELEEQAEFEHSYNRRFETEENLKIRRFPRKIEGSLRRKDDSRKKKREEIAVRKKEEKKLKQQEIRRKQKGKLVEIEEQLQKLKELTGNPELGFKDEEILEDFDPEKHDKKMNELFNEDYYNQEEDEHPVFEEDGYNLEYEDINMDCEANYIKKEGKKLTRSKKKKLRKKGYKDIMDIAKPPFDPEVHNSFKGYFDEYYGLDCEDFIDDLPCRFKYREVVPNNYGLSVEEILLADDKELNQWVSIKKFFKRRPEHVEKNEVKIYSKKARDEGLKKKIFSSLYSEEKDDSFENNLLPDDKDVPSDSRTTAKKMEKKDKSEGNTNSNLLKDKNYNKFVSNSLNNSQDYDQEERKNKTQKSSESDIMENSNLLNNISNVTENGIEFKKRKKRKHSDYKISMGDNSEINETKVDRSSFNHNEEQYSNSISVSRGSVYVDSTVTKKQKTRESNSDDILKVDRYTLSQGDKNINTTKNGSFNDNSLNNKKKKRNKKKGQFNIKHESSLKDNINVDVTNFKPNNVESIAQPKKKLFKKKQRGGIGIKQKKFGDITELSDGRLRAYGLKPKQFRSKIKYKKRNEAS